MSILCLSIKHRLVDIIERAAEDHHRENRHFMQQKETLELGRLEEKLQPPSDLRTILDRAASTHLKPIQPIQWYYEFTTVENIWGGPNDPLVYKATLLLADTKEYLGYSIRTWPSPYNTTGISLEVKLQQEWALDPNKGNIFVPTQCRGLNPIVCRAGAQYAP
jgi:hypothetical protein